ncbi:hypothetical protein [Vibrio mexicanus]|uniref:hypothetical protein n=1 Tax=Vibrio mexicanus TaxID=1004326 RepID=UPI000AAA52F7
MEKAYITQLAHSALKAQKRTLVTDVFVRQGFTIQNTDFDDVTFASKGVSATVAFDRHSNATQISVLDSHADSLSAKPLTFY